MILNKIKNTIDNANEAKMTFARMLQRRQENQEIFWILKTYGFYEVADNKCNTGEEI